MSKSAAIKPAATKVAAKTAAAPGHAEGTPGGAPGGAVTTAPGAAVEPALVVFGLDDAGKPHASRFAAVDAALAERAAALMGYRVLPVTTPEHAAAASGLPVGRVFASGKGFVPFVKAAAYEALSAFGEAYAPELPAEAAAPAITATPATWDTIAPGALVLASESDGEGWFEAVVTEDRGDDLLLLRWRDWPDVAAFPRRRDHLALLPSPAAQAEAVAQ